MYKKIKSGLTLQKSLNHIVEIALYVGLIHAVATVLFHRLLMVSGIWLWLMWVCVPVLTFLRLRRTPVVKEQIIRYAEEQSGETGFLWFDSEHVESEVWRAQINAKWETVQPPKLVLPPDWKKVVALLVCCVALLWVPIREDHQSLLPAVVQQELAEVKDEIEAMDALTTEPDPEIEGWKESIEDIENGISVGNTLRTLDDLSQQLQQRQEEAMQSVSEAMNALEQGDGEQLSRSLESLQKQNMLPPSAKDPQMNDQNGTGADEQGQASNPQASNQVSNELDKSEIAKQQQLSKQLQNLQSKLQDMQQSKQSQQSQQRQQGSNQNGSQSSGPKSFSNEQLQQLSKIQQANGTQNGSASQQSSQQGSQQSGNQEGQKPGEQSGQGSQGKPESGFSQGQNGDSPNQGGSNGGDGDQKGDGPSSQSGDETSGNSPLTYGANSDLIPNTNLRALDGVPQVDWSNSVQFGTAPGQANGVQNVSIATDGSVQSIAPMTGQQQVAPQHREAVKEFFATDQNE